jgi:hypothetical protein
MTFVNVQQHLCCDNDKKVKSQACFKVPTFLNLIPFCLKNSGRRPLDILSQSQGLESCRRCCRLERKNEKCKKSFNRDLQKDKNLSIEFMTDEELFMMLVGEAMLSKLNKSGNP